MLSFVETPRKFIIAELSIRKLGSSSVLIIGIISTDEDPSLRIESSATINLRGVSTKLNKYIVFTMQTYKKLIVTQLFCTFALQRFVDETSNEASPTFDHANTNLNHLFI